MGAFTQLDEFTFHHRLGETRGPALVVVTGPACGACRALKTVLMGSDFEDLALFEVDAARDMGLASEFGVFHLPAMFLYHDGRFHCELRAETTEPELRRALDRALAAPPEEAP